MSDISRTWSPYNYVENTGRRHDRLEEGRAINTGNGYNYEYTLTDHLGNNRVTFDMVNGKVSKIINPFGLDAPLQANR